MAHIATRHFRQCRFTITLLGSTNDAGLLLMMMMHAIFGHDDTADVDADAGGFD